MVNPTNQGYEFEWDVEERAGTELALKEFKCLSPKGVVFSGKKYESYLNAPLRYRTHESFWKFRIASEILMQNFLIVGSVLEPVVLLEKGIINLNQLLIGGKAVEGINIIN